MLFYPKWTTSLASTNECNFTALTSITQNNVLTSLRRYKFTWLQWRMQSRGKPVQVFQQRVRLRYRHYLTEHFLSWTLTQTCIYSYTSAHTQTNTHKYSNTGLLKFINDCCLQMNAVVYRASKCQTPLGVLVCCYLFIFVWSIVELFTPSCQSKSTTTKHVVAVIAVNSTIMCIM